MAAPRRFRGPTEQGSSTETGKLFATRMRLRRRRVDAEGLLEFIEKEMGVTREEILE